MRTLAIPALLLAALLLGALLLAACGDTSTDNTTSGATPPTDDRSPALERGVGKPAAPGPLARELAAKKAAGMKRMPDEVKALIRRSGEELAATGLAAKAKQVGSEAPDFTLKDGMGNATTLADLRKDGPVVLTFYRGKW